MKPEKFTIQFNTPLDAEYILRLAFNSGVKWFSGSEEIKNTECKEFGFSKEGIVINIIRDAPLYKFPSQAEEIVKLFEKEKEPEFKVGDWVRWHTGETGVILKRCPEHSDSWDVKGVGNSCSERHLTFAAPSEIEAHLIKEAKEKGLVHNNKLIGVREATNKDEVNDKGKTLYGGADPDKAIVGCSISYNSKTDTLYTWGQGLYVMYEKGTWATVLPSHPKIEINGYKAKFEDWGLDFNGGCAKIDRDLFIDMEKLLEGYDKSNKKITSVKIGAGEFTASQIKEIADYYNNIKNS